MAASNSTFSCELSATLLNIAEVCNRIQNLISKPSSSNSPLIDLVKDRVRHLVAAVEYFSTQITLPDADLQNASTHTDRLRLVKELLTESLYLLDFCTYPNTDVHGDDGAINAVWGLPSASPPPPSVIANELRPQFASFVDKYIDAFHPRYIHPYSTSDVSPYIVDKSTAAASGSFGTVRKVFHKTTGESFAAKSFHNVLSNRDRKKILRELGCLELCVHRNLITLVEAFELKDDPHTITIVMAPWAPYTLWNFLLATDTCRNAEFPWFEPNLVSSDCCIYRIMLDVVAAVAFLHERSIKHKDIKPQNILLYREATGAIRPIVTDVGETKVYRAGTATDPKRSSYEYLAPEQQLETENMQSNLKADIWQLGCCFAMLLAVARSGLSGLEKLWNSFTDTAENCSCNIANESVQFMAALHDICLPGSISQKHAHWVVTRMLDPNPTTRFSIQDVRLKLANLSKIDSRIV
ncbi:hypothetical protein B7463_g12334, partial [Scytalidium lignicola]